MLAAAEHATTSAEPPARPKRPSVRPSAFGLPFAGVRAKTATPDGTHGDAASSERALPPLSEAAAEARAAGTSGIKRIAARDQRSAAPNAAATRSTRAAPHTHAGPEAHAAPASPHLPVPVTTDIEELLPISQAVKSLPRPPRLSGDSQPPPAPTPRRFPWASLTVFALVLAASSVPLFHYSDMREQPRSEADDARGQPAAQRAPVQRHARTQSSVHTAVAWLEREHSGQRERLPAALLAAGERALDTRDGRLAEAFYARAYELAPSDARAEVGLARVRLLQGDLEGAEGWLLAALAKEPQIAEYRLLHADVLERRGQPVEAKSERAKARSIANFARSTPAR